MTCARCGCGVYNAEDQIVMTKVWHKCCFRCSNCNCKLDKCSTRLFQGEIFCDGCYGMLLKDLAKNPSLPHLKNKLCRVQSSPSCICINDEIHNIKGLTNSSYRITLKVSSSTKIIRSCSCLPDSEDNSIQFPIPREVANYYNRINMKRKTRDCPPKHFFIKERPCSAPRNAEMCPRVTLCTGSSRKQNPFKNCRIPSEDVGCCCCTKQISPACTCPYHNSVSPSCLGQDCSCNLPCSGYSPHKRKVSPHRRARCCFREDHPHIRQFNVSKQEVSSDPDISHTERCSKCRECRRSKNHHHSCCCPECSLHRDYASNKKDRVHQDCCNISPKCLCCPVHKKVHHYKKSDITKVCVCGKLNPCSCKKIKQLRDECSAICVRCKQKVYAAERIITSSGPFHTSCFSCYCCHKLLDVKTIYESKGEIYCKNCYNDFTGNQYYGYGSSQC